MKKLIKKIEIKPLLTTVVLILIQTIMFFATKLLQGNPHVVGNFIDEAIPFNVWFIIPYYIWYILIFAVPYYTYLKDKDRFYKYTNGYV